MGALAMEALGKSVFSDEESFAPFNLAHLERILNAKGWTKEEKVAAQSFILRCRQVADCKADENSRS